MNRGSLQVDVKTSSSPVAVGCPVTAHHYDILDSFLFSLTAPGQPVVTPIPDHGTALSPQPSPPHSVLLPQLPLSLHFRHPLICLSPPIHHQIQTHQATAGKASSALLSHQFCILSRFLVCPSTGLHTSWHSQLYRTHCPGRLQHLASNNNESQGVFFEQLMAG
jgi:hypothetical protein